MLTFLIIKLIIRYVSQAYYIFVAFRFGAYDIRYLHSRSSQCSEEESEHSLPGAFKRGVIKP